MLFSVVNEVNRVLAESIIWYGCMARTFCLVGYSLPTTLPGQMHDVKGFFNEIS